MGAIGENGARVLNHDVIRASRVSEQALQSVESRERNELDRRLRVIRSVHPRESLVGSAAVIVDDGIATGATMRAAIGVARAAGAATVIVATPVAPPDVVADLLLEADRVICLEQPHPFWSVGSWYRRFDAVSDAEVANVLSSYRRPAG
jgi:putative phosphoribosyl transferase